MKLVNRGLALLLAAALAIPSLPVNAASVSDNNPVLVSETSDSVSQNDMDGSQNPVSDQDEKETLTKQENLGGEQTKKDEDVKVEESKEEVKESDSSDEDEREEEDNINFELVENLKVAFENLLNEYFGNMLPENLLDDCTHNIIMNAVKDMEKERQEECFNQFVEAMDIFDQLPYDETEYFIETEYGLYNAVMISLSEALTMVMNNEEIEDMSLLPLEEVKAYLILDNTVKTIDDVLNNLQDSNGNPIYVDASATTVWRCKKDDADGIETFEKYVIGSGAEIDLTIEENVTVYVVEFIVGDDKQLNVNNKRYIVTVYLSNEVDEQIEFQVYSEDEEGKRKEVVPVRKEELYNKDIQLILAPYGKNVEPMKVVSYVVDGHTLNSNYYLGISSIAVNHPERDVEVYTFAEYLSYLSGGGVPITEQILNQDMQKTGTGYQGNFKVPSNIMDAFERSYVGF